MKESVRDLVEFLGLVDLDKTNTHCYLEKVSKAAGENPSVSHLLDVARKTPVCQRNPCSTFCAEKGSFTFFLGDPQSAKTGVETFFAVQMGLIRKLAPIFLTQNKADEIKRFKTSIISFNKLIERCAEIMGCSDIPEIRLFEGGKDFDDDEYTYCLQKMKTGRSLVIPVFISLLNKNRTVYIKKCLTAIAKVLGYDSEDKGLQRVNAVSIVDEADLAKKGVTKEVEKELRKKFEKRHFLIDSATCVAFVTATVPALVVSEAPLISRPYHKVHIPRSINYHGYWDDPNEEPGYNIIRRQESTREEYFDYITRDFERQEGKPPEPHAGMVYSNCKSLRAERIEEAGSVANIYKRTRRFLTVSWSADELDIFTPDKDIQKAVEALGFERVHDENHDGEEGGEEEGREDNSGEVDGNDEMSVENERSTVAHYQMRLTTKQEVLILDYTQFITSLFEQLGDHRVKSILFVRQMGERGTCICGTKHEHHLDSLYLDALNSSVEMLIQVAGRLCAVQASCPPKILFASKEMHDRHMEALESIETFSGKETNFFQQLAKVERNVELAGPNGKASDEGGVYKTASRVLPLTRPRLNDLKRKADQLTRYAKKNKVAIVSEEEMSQSTCDGFGMENREVIAYPVAPKVLPTKLNQHLHCLVAMIESILRSTSSNMVRVSEVAALLSEAANCPPLDEDFTHLDVVMFIAENESALLLEKGVEFDVVNGTAYLSLMYP